jgi:hypothetical protein
MGKARHMYFMLTEMTFCLVPAPLRHWEKNKQCIRGGLKPSPMG